MTGPKFSINLKCQHKNVTKVAPSTARVTSFKSPQHQSVGKNRTRQSDKQPVWCCICKLRCLPGSLVQKPIHRFELKIVQEFKQKLAHRFALNPRDEFSPIQHHWPLLAGPLSLSCQRHSPFQIALSNPYYVNCTASVISLKYQNKVWKQVFFHEPVLASGRVLASVAWSSNKILTKVCLSGISGYQDCITWPWDVDSHKNGPRYFDANDNSVEDADDDNVAHQHYWRSQHQAGESQREPALSFSSIHNVYLLSICFSSNQTKLKHSSFKHTL